MATMKSKKKRMIKTLSEISKIRKAVRYTEDAIRYALSEFRVGMTEKELARKIRTWAKKRGLRTGFCLVQGDENSASIHGKPKEHKIRNVLLIDVGLVYKGYFGDITRTFLLKKSKKMKKVYSVVKKAYEDSIIKIMPDIECKKIDAIARKIITDAGYKFEHSLGHGLGLQIHEFPRIGKKSIHIFQNNMVFTIEPGIYLKHKFGIRIEDVFAIINKKLVKLGSLPII
jgi:Xaa-Pro dipeptidase